MGFVEDCDEVLIAFSSVEASMEQVNKERAEGVAKPSKKPRGKKSDAAGGGHEIGDETAATTESFRSKRKSTSTSGEREASRAKKGDGKPTLAATILQANNLIAKMKPTDVEAMYKSLEEGFGQCFPYGQDPLPCKIPADKIHFALDSLKYRVFVEKRKDQVQLEAEALGTIRRKPELYCVPLKRAPIKEVGQRTKGRG